MFLTFDRFSKCCYRSHRWLFFFLSETQQSRSPDLLKGLLGSRLASVPDTVRTSPVLWTPHSGFRMRKFRGALGVRPPEQGELDALCLVSRSVAPATSPLGCGPPSQSARRPLPNRVYLLLSYPPPFPSPLLLFSVPAVTHLRAFFCLLSPRPILLSFFLPFLPLHFCSSLPCFRVSPAAHVGSAFAHG